MLPLPSRTHPPKTNLVVYTEELTHLLPSRRDNPVLNDAGQRIGGARLLAVVVEGLDGERDFRGETAESYAQFHRCVQYEQTTLSTRLPHEKVNSIRPSPNARGLSAVTRYGVSDFSDLFNSRQRVALMTLADLISEHSDEPCSGLLTSVLSRCADYWSSCAVWSQGSGFVAHTFGRQALPMVSHTGSPSGDCGRDQPVTRERWDRAVWGGGGVRSTCCVWSPLPTCHRHYPGRSDGACSLVDLHRQRPSLCNSQVGSCNYCFGACSAFTHVMACTLTESPSDPLHRKLRQLRCLRRRFDCYRVERTSSRAGVAPAEVQRLSRRTITPIEKG